MTSDHIAFEVACLMNAVVSLAFDFNGKTLLVATNHIPPYMVIDKTLNINDQKPEGMEIFLLDTLARKFNFSYKLLIPKDGEWGIVKNTSWTGMIGMVHKKEADIAVAFISPTSQRMQAVDFSTPYQHAEFKFISKRPGRLKLHGFLYLWPFTFQLWTLMVVTSMIGGIVFHFLTQLAREENPPSAWWFIVCSLTFQASPNQPKKTATQIFVAVWWIFALVMMQSYAGSLISSASFPPKEEPIDTVRQVLNGVDNNDLMVGTIKGSQLAESFLDKDEPIIGRLGRYVRSNPNESLLGSTEGPLKVLSGKFVFVQSNLDAELEMHRLGRQKFHLSEESLFHIVASVAFQKNAPYKIAFNQVIIKLFQTGHFDHWAKLTISKYVNCTVSELTVSSKHLLDAKEMSGAFYLLLIGYCVSTSTLLAEFWRQRFLRKNRNLKNIQLVTS